MSIIISLYDNHSIEIYGPEDDNALWHGATHVKKLTDREVMKLCHEHARAEIEAENDDLSTDI